MSIKKARTNKPEIHKLEHRHIPIPTTGDNSYTNWVDLLALLDSGWQIVSATPSNTIIHYLLLSPLEKEGL